MRLNCESLPLQFEVLGLSPPSPCPGRSLKKEAGRVKTGIDPSEERDMATTCCYLSYLIKLTNHIIIRGVFNLSALKVAVLVNYAVILVNTFLFL